MNNIDNHTRFAYGKMLIAVNNQNDPSYVNAEWDAWEANDGKSETEPVRIDLDARWDMGALARPNEDVDFYELALRNFVEDMGAAPPRLWIARRDFKKNFCKENCFWSSEASPFAGFNSPCSKLTRIEVEEILHLVNSEGQSCSEVAKLLSFKVKPNQVYRIARGLSYRLDDYKYPENVGRRGNFNKSSRKITDDDVRHILKLAHEKGHTPRQIALVYPVSASHIDGIINARTRVLADYDYVKALGLKSIKP